MLGILGTIMLGAAAFLPTKNLEGTGNSIGIGLLALGSLVVVTFSGFVSGLFWPTLESLYRITLPMTAALLACLWARGNWEKWAFRGFLCIMVPLMSLAVLPSDGRHYLGIPLPAPAVLTGPFVNPNHVGTCLAVAFPVWLFRMANGPNRLLGGVLAACTVAVVLYVGSTGPILVLGAQTLLCGIALKRWKWLVLSALTAPGIFWLGFESGVDFTLHDRTYAWGLGIALFSSHLLAGIGPRQFARAVEPLRTDSEFEIWNSAHNDYLEWCIEGGVPALLWLIVFIGLVFWIFRPQGRFQWVMAIGAGGVFGHALLDFPLQVPALTVTASAALACSGPRRRAPAFAVRTLLIGGAFLCALTAAFEARTALVRRTASAVRAGEPDAAVRLAQWAPRHPEGYLYRARQATRRQDALDALEEGLSFTPDHGRLLRGAARVAARAGESERALELAEEVIERHPSDYRSWVSRAETIEQVAPERAHSAWVDVLVRTRCPKKLNCAKRAYGTMPVPIFWVAALESAPAHVQRSMAPFFRDDPVSVLLLHEQLELLGFDGLGIETANAKLALGDVDGAITHLGALEGAAARKRLAEVYERSKRWGLAAEIWKTFDTQPRLRNRYLRALSKSAPAEQGLRVFEQYELKGIDMLPVEYVVKAELQARLGRVADCHQSLERAGRDGRSIDRTEFCRQAR